MSNIELIMQKHEAVRVILAAVEAYGATVERLLAESNKLLAEAEALLIQEGLRPGPLVSFDPRNN